MLLAATAAAANGPSSDFLRENCLDCHSGSDSEAGFDIEAVGESLGDPFSMAAWIKMFDRVSAGEMPPPEYGEVDSNRSSEFLAKTKQRITEHQREQFQKLGRVRGRRLTNAQLERTLHDLLAIDVPLASMMSEEPRRHGFNNIADAQAMSHFQLASHLSVVDTALDAALERAADDDSELWHRDYNPRQLARENPRSRCRDPEMRKGLAVVWSHGLVFYGRITSTTIRESGWYEFTVKASAIKKPQDKGVWCTVRSGRCNSGAPLMNWIGSFEATSEPREMTYRAWIPEDHMLEIRPSDRTLRRARTQGGQVGSGECEDQDVPGLALHGLQIRRIYLGGTAAEAREALFGELDVRVNRKGRFEFGDKDLVDRMTRQLHAFTRRAFRRDVNEDQIKPYTLALRADLDSGMNPTEALRKAYRTVLCSPRFLYLVEPPGELDDYAIASRLSYALTGSMPDKQLWRLARQGNLHRPNVLREQLDRLLDGESGNKFVQDFTDQWLDLVDIDFTDPDRKLYPDFDIVVQDAMLQETRRYIKHMIDHDQSAAGLVDSDFTFLNSRLARYYGIDGVEGDRFEKVLLKDGQHRGGLLSHGSILKVTANGTNTSPVLRGVWVCERILGQTIPPPPENVPAIEPDIRGATTVREMLDKHTNDEACASCHKKIDPPGFALENFDAAGRWRDRYIQIVGRKVTKGPSVDPSYAMADGRSFDGFDSFRKLIAKQPESLARNFAEEFLTYATGETIQFADRETIDQIVGATKKSQYGLRSIIHHAIVSDIFMQK